VKLRFLTYSSVYLHMYVYQVTFDLLILLHRSIFPIHPNFRLVAIGEPKKSASQSERKSPLHSPWINPELLSMFQFHHVMPLPVDQEKEVILRKVRNVLVGFIQHVGSELEQAIDFKRPSQ